MALIEFSDKGLCCKQGNFYIDPWKPVEKAIITHAHSDHAYAGHKHYLSHPLSRVIMQARLGDNHYQTISYNESININGVRVTLFPSGHILGAAQVRLEYNNEVWVVSGDYKVQDDGLSGAFEPVKCNAFITESTFGLPIYNWKPQEVIYREIRNWVLNTRAAKKTPVIIAYSLGKAQRVLQAVAPLGLKIFMHGATYNMYKALVNAGIPLPQAEYVGNETSKEKLRDGIIIAPSGADGTNWLNRFSPYATGICSGWMQVRGNIRRRNADAGFALSDHADWTGLLDAVKQTGAEKVFVTHGFQAAFSRYLNESGIWSAEVKTEYGNDEEGAPLKDDALSPDEVVF